MRKKELGQFFSGKLVAKLLLALCKSDEVKTVIDPMCGIGDMLLQFKGKSCLLPQVSGVEIDPLVFSELKTRMGDFSTLNLVEGNAFDSNVIKRMLPDGYDLVITNPPYVRYQTLSKLEKRYSSALSMQEIRNNLVISTTHFTTITKDEGQFIESLIDHISGLSDLAVPSWILCSLLVKVGGRLAIVVPETWLNRNYAQIVKYLLLRWFQIEYIIEDANSTWFSSAQVKTILLVAKRIKSKQTMLSWGNEKFVYTQLYSTSRSNDSLVGNLYPLCDSPEKEFIKAIDNAESVKGYFQSQKILITEFSKELHSVVEKKKWYKSFHNQSHKSEPTLNKIKSSSSLIEWYDFSNIRLSRLCDLGVSVSQGLRTGANDFFYLNYESIIDNEIKVYPNKITGVKPFQVSKKYFKEVLRKQSELPDQFSLSGFSSNGLVLSLQEFALCEDIDYVVNCQKDFEHKYQTISEPLANYIRIVSKLRNGNKLTENLIPDLSAVKTNARLWNPRKPNVIPRFWYMLPEFSKRHSPDLFIPRVNGSYVKTRLNAKCNYLIDANFSTLWLNDLNSPYNNYALLALLNSTWAIIAMEEFGTVMGGGALKLEATQLNQIPFPDLDTTSIKKLTEYGAKLSTTVLTNNELICKIDSVIISALGLTSNSRQKLEELSQIKANILKKRSKK